MMWLLKLYVLGTFVSLLSAFLGLVDSLCGLQLLWGTVPPRIDHPKDKAEQNEDLAHGIPRSKVTKQGSLISIYNTPTFVTLGVTSSMPCLPLPNVLLIARINEHDEKPPISAADMGERTKELSRLLPLRYVRLSIYNKDQRLLKLRTASHRNYYLRLHDEYSDSVFQLWTRLVHVLHCGLSFTCKDPCIIIPYSFVHNVVDMGSSSEDSDTEAWITPGTTTVEAETGTRKRSKAKFTLLKGHIKKKTEAEGGHKDGPCYQCLEEEHTFISHRHEELTIPGKPVKGYCYCKDCDACVSIAPCEPSLGPADEDEVTGWKQKEHANAERPAGMDEHTYGIWVRDKTIGMMPLSRLSCLVAAGETGTDLTH